MQPLLAELLKDQGTVQTTTKEALGALIDSFPMVGLKIADSLSGGGTLTESIKEIVEQNGSDLDEKCHLLKEALKTKVRTQNCSKEDIVLFVPRGC